MYSTCPDENHQAPTQCFARGGGRFTNIDIRLGACTKEGDIELTDLGPYEVQEQHPFFFNFPDNAQDWHQKYGILSKQAAEDGLRSMHGLRGVCGSARNRSTAWPKGPKTP